jgi:hypothetical protein
MLEILFYSLTILITTIGFGEFLNQTLFSSYEKFLKNKFNKFIFGYFFIQFISLSINFIYPLNKFITTFIILLGILFFLKFNKKKYKIFFYVSCASVLATLIFYKTSLNNDFSLYHGPFLSVIQNEKIIFGLNNLHFRFGHISSQQYYEIIFSNHIIKDFGMLLSISVFFSAFIYWSIETLLKQTRINESYIFLFLVTIYCLIRLSRFNEYGNDLVPNILGFYLIYLFLFFFETNKQSIVDIKKIIIIFTLIFSLIIFSKLTLLIFGLLPLYLIIKYKLFPKILFSFKFILIGVFCFFFISKNIINTSCLFYPVSFKICINTSWLSKTKNSQANVEERAIQSESWAKGWPQRDSKIYKNYSKNFNKNFNWLSSWMKRHFFVVTKNILIFLILPLFLMLIIFYKNKFQLQKNSYKNKNLKNLIFLTFVGCIFWFTKAPIYRYGFSYIISFLSLILIYIFFKNLNINNFKGIKKIFKILLFLSIVVFIGKNFQRIYIFQNNSPVPEINFKKKNLKFNSFNHKHVEIRYIEDGTCFYGTPICTNFPKAIDDLIISNKSNYLLFNVKN